MEYPEFSEFPTIPLRSAPEADFDAKMVALFTHFAVTHRAELIALGDFLKTGSTVLNGALNATTLGLTVPAAGKFTDLDAQSLTLGGNQIGGVSILIGDDGVGNVAVPRTGGFAFITASGETAYPAHNFSALLWYDLGTSPRLEKSTGWTNVGDNASIIVAPLTGTSGIDGEISFSGQSGNIQIENRTGGARHFQVTFM